MAKSNKFAAATISTPERFKMLLESVGLTFVVVVAFYFIDRHNSIGLYYGTVFWIALVPLLCTLNFGLGYGLLSLAILFYIAIYYQPELKLINARIYASFAGILSITIITSIFSSYWRRKVDHVEHLNFYLLEKLDDLSKDYFLMKLSHERLEHNYITKPISFREAVYAIKRAYESNGFQFTPQLGLEFLSICSQYCSLYSAAFCQITATSGKLETLATYGPPFEIDLKDPLLKAALKKQSSHYVAVNSSKKSKDSQFLAVIPLITSEDMLSGVIIIKEMPFLSLTEENIEALSAFSSVLMINAHAATQLAEVYQRFPEFSHDFLAELQTSIILKKAHNISSILGQFIINDPIKNEQIVNLIQQKHRSLDVIDPVQVKQGYVLYLLMPLTTLQGGMGYQNRIAEELKRQLNITLNQDLVFYRYHEIQATPLETQLEQRQGDINDEFPTFLG